MLQEEFEEACALGDTDALSVFLKNGAVDPAFNHNFALRRAAKKGRTKAVQMLLADSRVDPCALANDALVLAVWNDRVDVVQVLLADPRVDPSVDGNLLVQCAAGDGMCDVLLTLVGDPRVDCRIAIIWATSKCARILAADPRCGIHAHRALYQQHHPALIDAYDRAVRQCFAIAWFCTRVRPMWESCAEPLVERKIFSEL